MRAQDVRRKEIESVKHKHIRYISVFINKITFRKMHAHKDIEFILVLKGELGIVTPDEQFEMKTGDIAYFNPTQPHSCWSAGDTENILLVIQADPSFCVNYFPAMRNLFVQSSNVSKQTSSDALAQMRSHFFNAAVAYFSNSDGNSFGCIGNINLLMDTMLHNVPYDMIPEDAYLSKANYEKRMLRIIGYIHEHYTEKISLKSIAESENLTTSYLSHFFTKNLNVSFQDFINELRFERAAYLLKNSDMKILDICIESGFSDSKYLNRMFISNYGMTPTEFRKQYKKEHPENKSPEENVEEKIYSREESLSMLENI